MRDPKRIPSILERLGDLWSQVPDWRLGQLFCNLQKFTERDLFFYEDEELLEVLKNYLGK